MDYSEELANYDEEWDGITPKKPRTGPLPLGKYQVEVAEARVEQSGGQYDNLQFLLTFQVISGDHEGAQHRKWTNLDMEQGREIAKQDCYNLGLEVLKCSDLPKMTAMLIGRKVEIALVKGKAKRDGGFWTNTYINKVLDPTGAAESIDPPSTDDGIDVPPIEGGENYPW